MIRLFEKNNQLMIKFWTIGPREWKDKKYLYAMLEANLCRTPEPKYKFDIPR